MTIECQSGDAVRKSRAFTLALALLIPLVLLFAGCGTKVTQNPADTAASHAGNPPPKAPKRPKSPTPPPKRPERQEGPLNAIYQGALKAKIGDEFAAIVLAGGRKTVVPVDSLTTGDFAYLTRLSEQKPLVAAGKSSMVVVESTDSFTGPKETLQVSKTEGVVETVQLCSPNVGRDQIGGTCMLYARVHWLDIAGYYVGLPRIFSIINGAPEDNPWTDPKYCEGLETIMTGYKSTPEVHEIPLGAVPFQWARAELRRGRPVLAALPREIELALPADFLAKRPWSGGDIGHQVVVNGFTWNKKTGEGTFHVVNSWAELMEFDLDLKYATRGSLIFEASLSPFGEEPIKEEVAVAEIVQKVTRLKSAGFSSLFKVTTNLGVRKILAPDAEAARRMVEER